jgi:D-glycero-alpha-D-manno-heptose-7-phosphate kinase
MSPPTLTDRAGVEADRHRGQVLRARAPLRVSFSGGGTDMPFYYTEHGGAVLASTINRYTTVTLAPGSDHGAVSLASLDYDLTVKYRLDEKPAYDGVLDLAKAAIRRLVPADFHGGFDVYVQSDAPAGSGLGGSSSLTLALIGTLAELTGAALDHYQLAELAYEVERVDLGMKGGKQDQYGIAFGGFNFIEFAREEIVVHPLRIPPELLRDIECHLLLCYTGRTRLSAGLISRQEELVREKRPETLAGLARLRTLCYEMRNALLRGRLGDFAELLNEEWRQKVAANPHVTTPAIDEMLAVARQNGALGGKLLGAGAGGYLLLFCEVNRKRKVYQALEQLGGQFMNFSFVKDGLSVWRSQCP